MQKCSVVLCAAVMALAMALTGCAKPATPVPVSSDSASSVGSVPAPAEPVKANDKAILVVSFGTSYNESRDITIGAIEKAIQTAFPDYEVRRAFTSQIIIDKLAKRDQLIIDNVEQALDRAVSDGVKTLIVQPTHLMNGFEYTDLANALKEYTGKFERMELAEPLLTSDADFTGVIDAITADTAPYDDGKTAICFMGHGTEADSNGVYAKMQEMLHAQGHPHYFIGTVEATPTLEDLMAAVKAGGYTKVILEPLMVVAGDHANNDMAGTEPDSWKSQFEAAGYKVECILRGLGEFPAIQKIYAAHTQAAITAAENTAADSTEQKNLTPISAHALADGSYPIEVESSSSMFRIVNAELTVENGAMSAVLTLSGKGYRYLYIGTGAQALQAPETDFIPYTENAQGQYTYKIPVEALDQPLNCAAFSSKKETWYDRMLTFHADTLPKEALLQPVNSAAAIQDGAYLAAVTLDGGSGRARVVSPARVVVQNGKMRAAIEWSSPFYDYMLVNGEKFLPVNTEGNAVFEIPVAALDCDLEVTADTTAMGTPHEVKYTLHFDAASLQPEK